MKDASGQTFVPDKVFNSPGMRLMNRTIQVFTGLLVVTLGLRVAEPAIQAQEKKVTQADGFTAEQQSVVKSAENYRAAYNKGDIQKLMSFFAPEARLITVDGDVFQGIMEIQGLFQAGFDSNPGLTMTNDLRSIRLIGDSVALESGFSSTTTRIDKRPDTVAYHIIHVKRNGEWKIFEVIEAEPAKESQPLDHAEKLAELDFLIGDWQEDAESDQVHHRARWSANHNYILIDYLVETDKKLTTFATQRVGWDAKNKSIRSWLFEEDGGHGTALWVRSEDGKSWLIKSEAVLNNGQELSASTRLKLTANNQIEILKYDRTAEGKALPDMPVIRLTKKAPAPSALKSAN